MLAARPRVLDAPDVLSNLPKRFPSPINVPASVARYRESDNDHPAIALDDKTRVIDCKDSIQWILQRRSSHQWRSLSYCRSRDALIREARKLVEHACESLRSLPEYHA
jgi:hypothetical protein